MVAGDVPDTLKPPCRLIGLDMGALVAGATMRGEFEERLKAVIDEVQKSAGEIVLFIDEVRAYPDVGCIERAEIYRLDSMIRYEKCLLARTSLTLIVSTSYPIVIRCTRL